MGLFDEIKDKAGELFEGNKEALKDGIEKVGDFIDEKTGDKFKDQVDAVQGAASGLVGKVSGGDQGAGAPAEGAAATEEPQA
ncbi:antitoxin [Psychromicrobium xiongbiense]|uniref:antitoxin n=1 Tax=Psychromicrobium xiongbiense TaxID=3051184 RepID=UPI002557015E|nr:antitoxin [Psychromicrobium sp. YIM S02556]